MTPNPLTRSWRRARVATAALALTAAALTLTGAATTGTAGALTPAGPAVVSLTSGTPCLTAGSAHRVRADSGLDGVDPNDLTVAQTQAAEARLASRARQRGVDLGRASLPKTKVDVDRKSVV